MSAASGDQIVETIARRWPQIRECFTSEAEWRTFSGNLLALLRRMDDDPDGETEKQIRALFDASPAAHELPAAPAAFELPRRQSRGGSRRSGATDDPDDVGFGRFRTSEPPQPTPARAKEPASAPAPPAPDVVPAAPPLPTRHALVSVLYGTDRAPLAAQNGRPRYGDEGRESLSFGVATVSIPDRNTHIKGRLERPRWYRLEFRENVQKHVVITALEALDQEQFEERARLARARDGSNDEALLFVHGFNVSFEDSIRRTAQFATDLEFGGVAIAYSWPSQGSLFAYHQDGDVSESSMFRLAELIALLRSTLGLKRLHLVAHSMGSRLLARALNQHVLTASLEATTPLNQVVFAAPDINAGTFGGFARVFAQSCERCTLYASGKDLALTASKWIYKRPRAGADAQALVEYGVDTIDATNVDDSMLGHSYFSDKRVLLQDLSELLFSGRPPSERYGLTEIAVGGGRYWQLDA
jgi:esterase/lipase superfamily enzyme